MQTLFVLNALSLYISRRRQLRTDLVNLAEARGPAQCVGHGIDILKLRLALLNEGCEHLLGGLCLAVFLIIFLSVGARRERGVRLYTARLILIIVVRDFIKRHAFFQCVLIRGNKLGVYPQLVLVGAGGELGALIG